MRDYIENFVSGFSDLHARSVKLIDSTPTDKLFWQPFRETGSNLFPVNSVGEMILRSAGRVEQTFGGLTARLWDDPFEWTLPESFADNDAVLNYLNEVAATRRRGFESLKNDEDLRREIPAPEKLTTIFVVLLETLTAAENLCGRAAAIHRLCAAHNKSAFTD